MLWAIRARGEAGAALVELAIILPVLIILVLGVIDLGRVFYAYEALANATREGARYCALHATEAEAVRTQGTKDRIEDEIDGLVPGLSVTGTTCGRPGAGQPLRVTASATFQPLTPLISQLTGGDVVLTASATMVQWQ